jgi:hypothetical protein
VSSHRPKVFISYSHDSDSHKKRAVGLNQRLRRDGVDSWIDEYENGTPQEGWPRWMLNRLDWADFVLVVCSEVYYRRFRGKGEPEGGKGADWEGQMVTLEMYESKNTTVKFVPVLFNKGDLQFIPEPLRALTYYNLDTEVTSSFVNYTKLLAFLHGKAGTIPSPLGLPKNVERREEEPLHFESEHQVGMTYIVRQSDGPSMMVGAAALRPEDEPGIIKDMIRNSKGVKKYWVNYTPDGYVLTLLLTLPSSQITPEAVREFEKRGQEISRTLKSESFPIHFIMFRTAEGVLFAAAG